jgi:signal transduction histidine kinase
MNERVDARSAGGVSRQRPRRRTVRLRLTAVYSVLFLVSGALLLMITYGLFRHATSDRTFGFPGGATGAVVGQDQAPPADARVTGGADALTADQLAAQAARFRKLAADRHAEELRQLLIQSGIALSVTTVAAIVLGWIVAGRVLRPLRTITTAAQHISEANLHERLAIEGPDDELKELGDTVDGLLERLEAAFRSQRQFVANASHELRTPLARQRALIQVALSDPDANADSLRDAHERVLATGAEQERLIEALLTLSRGQAGLERRQAVDLATVAERTLRGRAKDVEARGLHVDSDCGPAVTSGHPGLLERLVANLIDNAIRYNIPDGRLMVSTVTRADEVVLAVINTGPVIDARDVDGLVRPFQRLGPDRTRRDGLGLGLSIVDAIAIAHEARISVQPHPRGGLEVDVAFPAAEAAPPSGGPVATEVERHDHVPFTMDG